MNAIKTILIISIIAFGINFNYLSANPKSNQDTCEILLIGSSYFNYNNLPDKFENLSASAGKAVYIEMHGNNGLYLWDHARSSSTLAKINERDWDFVVLQGVGVLVAYPEHFAEHPVYPSLITLRNIIHANCESTRMIFCLPWAFEDGMTWYQNWTDDYEDMQIHVYNNTLIYSDEIGFEIAPVGWAWYGVLDAYNYPLHYLHMSDWNHPSLRGTYVMACAIYSTIFQESTVGNSYLADIPEEEALFFQQVATDTVMNNLELWNITPNIVGDNEIFDRKICKMNQNNPNPFNASTRISYWLSEKLHVKLIIFDSLGSRISMLVDEFQDPGNYEIVFDALGLKAGVYHYQLNAGDYIQSNSMILDH
nr:hypothetical protein [Bacteroidota bacterium]